jgi:hypothetical protein
MTAPLRYDLKNFLDWQTHFTDECHRPSVIDTTDNALAAYATEDGCHAWQDGKCHRGERVCGVWRRLPCDCAEQVKGRK